MLTAARGLGALQPHSLADCFVWTSEIFEIIKRAKAAGFESPEDRWIFQI